MAPFRTAYHQWHRRTRTKRVTSPDDPRVTAQVGGAGTPEAGPLSVARGPGLLSLIGPIFTARILGRRIPHPESRRSAARVLMDEGWVECNRGLSGGDKVGRVQRLVAVMRQANPGLYGRLSMLALEPRKDRAA
jgi:hypothetical protein